MACGPIIIAIHPDIHREGVCAIIREHMPECSIHTVAKEAELVNTYHNFRDAICLISLPDDNSGLESLINKLYKINPEPKIALLVSPSDIHTIKKALKADIRGIFSEQCPAGEFLRMLTAVSKGKSYYDSSISDSVMLNYKNRYPKQPKSKKKITKRENEILKLIVNGYTSAEIAKKLFISPRTVEKHRFNLMGKLKLKNTAELVRFALRGRE